MKKMSITIALLFTVALVPISGMAAAQHINSADEGTAFRFYNGNSSGTVSIKVESSGAGDITVTNQTSETVIDGSGSDPDIMSELLADVADCTNDTGNTTITVDSSASLDADSTDGELLDGTYTAAAGEWGSVLWDSSENEQINVYIPPENNYGFTIDKIVGYPQGTGELQLSVYRDQTLEWQAAVDIPYGFSNTNETASALSNIIQLPIECGAYMKDGEGVFLRGERTTMTGGTLGFTAE